MTRKVPPGQSCMAGAAWCCKKGWCSHSHLQSILCLGKCSEYSQHERSPRSVENVETHPSVNWTKAQLSFSILSRCQDAYSMKCWQVSQRLESCTEGDAVNAIERITTGACKAMIDLMSQPGANGTQVLKWKSQALECGFTSPALAPKPNRIWVASNLWGKRRCSAGNLCPDLNSSASVSASAVLHPCSLLFWNDPVTQTGP